MYNRSVVALVHHNESIKSYKMFYNIACGEKDNIPREIERGRTRRAE